MADDAKQVRNLQEQFNRIYKRANYAEQGEYHALLAEDHKRVL